MISDETRNTLKDLNKNMALALKILGERVSKVTIQMKEDSKKISVPELFKKGQVKNER